MKSRLWRPVLILLGVIFISFGGSPLRLHAGVEPQRILRVGIYQFKPLAFLDDEGNAQGLYVDILEEIARAEGWEILYVPGTWTECLRRLEQGEIDLLVAIAYSPERDQLYDFNEETLFTNWGQLYVAPDSDIESILDLRDKAVAGVTEDIYTTVVSPK